MVAIRRLFGLQRRIENAGQRARRVHGQWLTQAILGGGLSAPRIPTRKVTEGGFENVRKTCDGRVWADSWWRGAFRTTD